MTTFLYVKRLSLVMGLAAMATACSALFEEKSSIKTAEAPRSSDADNDGDASAQVQKGAYEKAAALLGRADTEIHLDNDTATARIRMEGGKGSHATVAVQADYPTKTVHLKQGYVGASQTDTFTQDLRNTQLDIVVVVDNSGSMSQEHQKVSTQLPTLLSKVQGTDWRIAVVNTDVNSSIPCYVIKSTDSYPKVDGSKTYADAAAEFKQRVISQGISGNGNEQGLATAIQAWKTRCPSGWYRNGSALATLILSDEDECSNGNGCGAGVAAARPAQLAAVYEELGRVTAKSARTYGIYYPPTHTQQMCTTGLNKANIYQKAVNEHGGTSGSICDASYDATFQTISDNLSVILRSQFKLTYAPDMLQFAISVNDVVVDEAAYERVGDLITFKEGHIPAEAAVIKVTYTYGSVPPQIEFALGNQVRFEDAAVFVNDVKLASTDYQLSSTAGQAKVSFVAMPAENADIRVVAKEDVPLASVFGIGTKVIPGTIEASVNGVKIPANEYSVDYVAGTVTFQVAPPRLAQVGFAMYRVEAPKLEYPFQLVDGAAAPDIRDAESDEVVRAEFKDNKVIFNEEDFHPNRIVVISYQFRNAQSQTINLPFAPIATSVRIRMEQLECSASAGQIEVTGSSVKVIGDCDLMVGTIKVSGDFIIERYQEFVFDKLRSSTAIRVLVDGKEVQNYRRDGRKIIFDSPLGVYAKVRVEEI